MLKIVVYVDQDRDPKVLPTTPMPSTVKELFLYVKECLQGKEPKAASFWSFTRQRYLTLNDISQLKQKEALLSPKELKGLEERTISVPQRRKVTPSRSDAVYRAQLWIETALLVLEPLEEAKDAPELAELREHVRKWTGNKYITYDLLQASRVQYPLLARRFDEVKEKTLHDHNDAVRLLYYTNNAWSSSEVLQYGFLLQEELPGSGHRGGGEGGDSKSSRKSNSSGRHNTRRNPFVFSSSMIDPSDKRPPLQERQTVLLCEVAPGRPWLAEAPLSTLTGRTPPEGYDCLLYEEDINHRDRTTKAMQYDQCLPPLTQVSVGHSHQALPRYVLLLVPRKRDTPSKGKRPTTLCGDTSRPQSAPPSHSSLSRHPSPTHVNSSSSSARRVRPQHTPQQTALPVSSTDSLSLPTPESQQRGVVASPLRTPAEDVLRPSQVRASFVPIRPSDSPRSSYSKETGLPRLPSPMSLQNTSVGSTSGRPSLYSNLLPNSPQRSPRMSGSGAPPAPQHLIPSSHEARGSPPSPRHVPFSREKDNHPRPRPTLSSAGERSAQERGRTASSPTGGSAGRPARAPLPTPPGGIRNPSPVLRPAPATQPLASAPTTPRGILQEAPASLRCGVHTAQMTTLYCNTCRELCCPYCASVGHHKTHEVVEAEEQASRLSADMQSLCHDLIQWLDHYRRVERQLRAEEERVQRKRQQRVHQVRGQLLELRRALDLKERILVKQMEETGEQVQPPVQEAAGVRVKYAKALAPLEQALQKYQTGSSAHTLQFLKIGPTLMKEALHSFRVRDQREELKLKEAVRAVKSANSKAEAVLSGLQINTIRDMIERLGTEAAGPLLVGDGRSPSPPVSPRRGDFSVQLSRASSTTCSSPPPARSPALGQSLVERCLLDLQRGHLWVIQNASAMFCPGQHRAVCSSPFSLLGLPWELRIAVLPGDPRRGYFSTSGSSTPSAGVDRYSPRSYDFPRGEEYPTGRYSPDRTPTGEEDQWLGIFLIPKGHQSRLDFRVIAFSEMTWTEWNVTGWTNAFIGKGWGLYPFLRRRDLMRTDRLARENTVKICIAPISDLY